MQAMHANNNSPVTQMLFENGDKTCSVDLVGIDSNGDCLFGSIIHQLHIFPLSSEEHKKAITELRAEVVDYIRTNINNFEHEIKGRLYAERSKKKIKGKIQNFLLEANKFLNDDLSRTGFWGGSETIKAVYLKYQVNVAVVDEESSIRFAEKFEPQYPKTLLLAYRLNSYQDIEGTGGARNHYCSVASIEKEAIAGISEFLASNIKITLGIDEVVELE